MSRSNIKNKSVSSQQTLFDVPAIQRHEAKEPSAKKKNKKGSDRTTLYPEGLNGVFKGKSLIYDNFSDYINDIRK